MLKRVRRMVKATQPCHTARMNSRTTCSLRLATAASLSSTLAGNSAARRTSRVRGACAAASRTTTWTSFRARLALASTASSISSTSSSSCVLHVLLVNSSCLPSRSISSTIIQSICSLEKINAPLVSTFRATLTTGRQKTTTALHVFVRMLWTASNRSTQPTKAIRRLTSVLWRVAVTMSMTWPM